MKVKLFKNAAANYVARCYRHARPTCGRLHNPDWEKTLKLVEGQWLEVETDYLFADQFNTAPMEGVSDDGLRVMGEDVEEVKDDVREGRFLDRWTNKNYTKLPDECLTPERKKYIYQFVSFPQGRGVVMKEKLVFPEAK